MPTENQIKALTIVKNNPNITGIKFARIMWKDSNMMSHNRATIHRHGLSYLFKLVKKGWLSEKRYDFNITDEGLKHLKKYNSLEIN